MQPYEVLCIQYADFLGKSWFGYILQFSRSNKMQKDQHSPQVILHFFCTL